eukprot:8933269-Alexandrium_andersonii.AAC.1
MHPGARAARRPLGDPPQVHALAPVQEHQGPGLVVRALPPQLLDIQRLGGPRMPGRPCSHLQTETAGQAALLDTAGTSRLLGRHAAGGAPDLHPAPGGGL